MGLLSFLLGEKIQINKEVEIPEIGKMVWEEDEESWKGSHSGLEILISLEKGTSSPSQELIDYALSILKDRSILDSALEAEKHKHNSKYPGFESEVSALKYSSIMFYRYKSKFNRIFASLEPEANYRAWRIEFDGTKCEGVGFDS